MEIRAFSRIQSIKILQEFSRNINLDDRSFPYNLCEDILGPGWKWNHYRPYSFSQGWDDRDAPDLKSSPEDFFFGELPLR
jgi:hypothetical protein